VDKGDHFRFGSVFIKKKVTKPNFFIQKTETGSNWPVLVWFFRTKTGSNRLDSVFSVWLGFFPVWLVCFPVWVRFGFFSFRLIKPKPNRTGRFFQNFNRFNRFFSRFGFFGYFFPVFSVFRFFCSPLIVDCYSVSPHDFFLLQCFPTCFFIDFFSKLSLSNLFF